MHLTPGDAQGKLTLKTTEMETIYDLGAKVGSCRCIHSLPTTAVFVTHHVHDKF